MTSSHDLPHLSSAINKLPADTCSTLADPRRILLLYTPAEQPHTVNSLASKLEISEIVIDTAGS